MHVEIIFMESFIAYLKGLQQKFLNYDIHVYLFLVIVFIYQMGATKLVFRGLPTTKAQTSLRIRAD